MKFGIIGAGMIGQFHGKAIEAMDGGELHSVFDLRLEGAEKLASQFGAKAYGDLDEFLAGTDPGVLVPPPVINIVSPPVELSGGYTSAEFWVEDISTTVGIASVTALISPPTAPSLRASGGQRIMPDRRL